MWRSRRARRGQRGVTGVTTAALGSHGPQSQLRALVKPEFAFVLEQALGHRVYGARLERAIEVDPRFSPTVMRVEPKHSGGLRSIPGLRNHSMQASWAARQALRQRAERGRIDAMFIHTQCAALLVKGMMRRVPSVISMDATPINYDSVGRAYGHHRQSRAAEWAKLQLYRARFGAASALTTWTEWAAESLVRDYGVDPSTIAVIRPGVDLGRFRPVETRRDGPVRILFVGSDFGRKGGEDLLQAMELLRGEVELHIVTARRPPGLRPAARASVHVGMSGDSEELLRLYRDADIFALPAHADCYPQALTEAAACGLPVVSCRVGAVSELVIEGESGLLAPPGDARSLARALQTLVDDPSLRAAMGTRGRELAERENNFQKNYESIVELLQRVSGAS
jgi:glycosyltransferase involved in cell wall biosynthesis